MTTCPNCDFENAESWTHCRECGVTLSSEIEAEKQQLLSKITHESQTRQKKSLYQDVVGARYVTHYLVWVMLLTVISLWQIILQLVNGGLTSFVPVTGFVVSAVTIVPVLAVLTWLVFKPLLRAYGSNN